jgi:hypothetical protein
MTRGGYRFVVIWAVGILLLYLIGACLGVLRLWTYKAETMKMRQAWLEGAAKEPGSPIPEINARTAGGPVKVLVGIYVNRIGEFAMKEAGWTAEFDIWFRWAGAEVNPGETFQVVNGQIETRKKQEAYVRDGEHYERYRVRARIAKFFEPARFPFADEPLTIQVEDGVQGVESLQFVADTQDSSISPAAILQDLEVIRLAMAVEPHKYESKRGDPRRTAEDGDVYSRFVFAMLLNPPGTIFHLKLFNALFASVAISFIVFFIKPIYVDPRFGLGVGAFFAAVGNIIYIGSILPRASGLTLTDMVNGIGLATIFLTLVQSAISLYVFDTMGRERLSRLFDRVSFAAFLIGYAVINLVLPLAAGS